MAAAEGLTPFGDIFASEAAVIVKRSISAAGLSAGLVGDTALGCPSCKCCVAVPACALLGMLTSSAGVGCLSLMDGGGLAGVDTEGSAAEVAFGAATGDSVWLSAGAKGAELEARV